MTETTIRRRKGIFADDLEPGRRIAHRGGQTVTAGLHAAFCDSSYGTNPLTRNREYARALGFDDLLCPPALAFALTVAQSADDLEQNMTALVGYDYVGFGAPLYIGDTIEAQSTVLAVRPAPRHADRGLVRVETVARNQHDRVVVALRRTLQLLRRQPQQDLPTRELKRPDLTEVGPVLPDFAGAAVHAAETRFAPDHGYFEDFAPSTAIEHARGRTLAVDAIGLAGRLDVAGPQYANQHHIDAYPAAVPGGRLHVFHGITVALALGLAAPDLGDQAIAEVEWAKLQTHAPVHLGDTLTVQTNVRALADYGGGPDLGLAHCVLRAFKHAPGAGEAQPVLTLQRSVALKRRAHYRPAT